MKRKILALLLVLAFACSLVPMALADDAPAAEADPEPIDVFVSISNAGLLTCCWCKVTVGDEDGDGALTINDALIAAHDDQYQGGAEAGYASAETQWGLSVAKLWGVENGGSYGYYVNDQMAMGLADPIKAADRIYAYVFKDTEGFSDAYSYFDSAILEVQPESVFGLTLNAVSFDENFAPVANPVAGARIVIDGEEHRITTDENGTVELTFPETGTHIVSAVSDELTMVPPVCVVTVTDEIPVDPGVPSGPDVKNFKDVPEDAWYYQAVKTAVDEGLIVGKDVFTFDPEANMTLAEYFTILYRMGNKAGLFEDKTTAGANWQDGAKYFNEKLELGYQDLDAPMLRRQMAVATAAYLKAAGGELGYVTREVKAFADAVDDEAAEDIAYMYAVKAIDGYDDDTFRPANTIRRCEVAQVVANMLANVTPAVEGAE